MRVLITGQTYYPGANGQAVFTIHLAEGLAARGHEVMAIVPNSRLKAVHAVTKGVRVEKRPAVDLAFLHPDTLTTLPWDGGISELMEAFQPEVVHIQDFYPLARVVLRAARQRGLPIVGTNHFVPENLLYYFPRALQGKLTTSLLWKVALQVYNHFDLITTPSRTAAEILRQQPIHIPVRAISNGVRTERFRPLSSVDRAAVRQQLGLDPNQTLFLFVGRLDPEKRIDVLVTALAKLGRRDVQLAIAGKGAMDEALKRLIQKYGLQDQARLLGYLPEEKLIELLNSADIFCMPSPQELQSIATLEALACGLPVLVANARALPELAQQGVNGFLFETDDADSLAKCMQEMLKSPQRWPSMGEASLRFAQEHALDKTIEKYLEIYREAVKIHPPARNAKPENAS